MDSNYTFHVPNQPKIADTNINSDLKELASDFVNNFPGTQEQKEITAAFIERLCKHTSYVRNKVNSQYGDSGPFQIIGQRFKAYDEGITKIRQEMIDQSHHLSSLSRLDSRDFSEPPIERVFGDRFKKARILFSANEATASRVSKTLLHSVKFETFNGEDMGLFSRWVNKLLSGFRISQPTETQACLITMHQLTGRAAELAMDIPNTITMTDLEELLLKLDRTFNASATEEVSKNLLANYVQREDMSIQDYALGLEYLYGRAYPFDNYHVSTFLKDRFVSGLISKEIQTKLRTPPFPETYRDAVNLSMALAAAHYPDHQLPRQRNSLWKMGTTMKNPILGRTTFDTVKTPSVMNVETQDVNTIKTWCSIHKSDRHSNSECRAQKSTKNTKEKKKGKSRTIKFKTTKGKRKFVRSLANTDELETSDESDSSSESEEENENSQTDLLQIDQRECSLLQNEVANISSMEIFFTHENEQHLPDFEELIREVSHEDPLGEDIPKLLEIGEVDTFEEKDEPISSISHEKNLPSTSNSSNSTKEEATSSSGQTSRKIRAQKRGKKSPPLFDKNDSLKRDATARFQHTLVKKPRKGFPIHLKKLIPSNKIPGQLFDEESNQHSSSDDTDDEASTFSFDSQIFQFDSNAGHLDRRAFATEIIASEPNVWDVHKIKEKLNHFYNEYFCDKQNEQEWKKRAKKRIMHFNYRVTRETSPISDLQFIPLKDKRKILECKMRNLFQAYFDVLEYTTRFDFAPFTSNLNQYTLLPAISRIAGLFEDSSCTGCKLSYQSCQAQVEFAKIKSELCQVRDIDMAYISENQSNKILAKTQLHMLGDINDPYELNFTSKEVATLRSLGETLRFKFFRELQGLVELNKTRKTSKRDLFRDLYPISYDSATDEQLNRITYLRRKNLSNIAKSLLSRYKTRHNNLLLPYGLAQDENN